MYVLHVLSMVVFGVDFHSTSVQKKKEQKLLSVLPYDTYNEHLRLTHQSLTSLVGRHMFVD